MRCGGLVVNSRSPVPGSNLGLGPPHSVICGAADRTVILHKYMYCIKTLGLMCCKIYFKKLNFSINDPNNTNIFLLSPNSSIIHSPKII